MADAVADPVGLLDLLELEQIETDMYRSVTAFDTPYRLYGGQVAAQALMAAGRTVPADRVPHSLHSYYLRGGASATNTLFRVEPDRDGRSYSARRVTAIQDGEIIFTMSVSFTVTEAGVDHNLEPTLDVPGPEGLPEQEFDQLLSIRGRVPPQVNPEAEWPSRFWARTLAGLADSPLLHACVLTYVSDMSSGLADLPDGHWASSSLDHAVWFHRPARLDEWVLVDLVPHTVAGGRGFYTGTVRQQDGTRVATLAQEALFRAPRKR
ncbi:acyl-CoA thioesterase [Parafrankia sp. FMc2]|uniref:acyl-CoA thioesterase n=1 Tax=Parafrankia sp. FMc2 TaxID=3233196 RepID=UPI0034D7A17F